VTELKDRDIYKEDWIGLKALDKKGALKFETTKGGHMQLSDKLLRSVAKKYFGPYGRKFDDSKQEVAQEL
jgi:palmitoyl-protein thioesterase